MTSITTTLEETRAPKQRTPIIDGDLHCALGKKSDLKQYLPKRWHAEYDEASVWVSYGGGVNFGMKPRETNMRLDSFPDSGGIPGSDLALMREQLFDRWDIRHGILTPLERVHDGELGLAVARAINDWMVDRWLDQDERFLATIVVPTEDPFRATSEIERLAGDPRFVQVRVLAATREPLGNAKYEGLLEAAAAHDRPVVVHVGGDGGYFGSSGSAAFYFDRRNDYPHFFQSHVVSLIANGVFDRLPNLKIILEEGGIVWMPALMWRLDRAWRAFRPEGGDPSRLPSEIVREHFWFTTQPIDEPEKPEYFGWTLDQLGMNDHVLFATDYPHFDFDSPDRALPATIADELREKILYRNAAALYGLTLDEAS